MEPKLQKKQKQIQPLGSNDVWGSKIAGRQAIAKGSGFLHLHIDGCVSQRLQLIHDNHMTHADTKLDLMLFHEIFTSGEKDVGVKHSFVSCETYASLSVHGVGQLYVAPALHPQVSHEDTVSQTS